MMSILLYGIAILILYLGFFVCYWLGENHWALYPTIFLTGSLVLLHLFLAIFKLRMNNDEKNKN